MSFTGPNLLFSRDFAKAAGISPRYATKVLGARLWNGHRLPVREVKGATGRAGKSLALVLDLASPELKALLNASETPPSTEVSTVPAEREKARPSEAQIAKATERHELIAPILDTEKGTAKRRDAVRDHAQRTGLSERMVYELVAQCERGGPAALLPSGRRDKGKARVLITRAWDKGIDLPEDTRAEIAARITREARSMVANDGASVREVIRLSGINLARYCAEAGSKLPRAHLVNICKLNKKWAERAEVERWRLVYLHDKDHKTYQDKAVPRVRRKLHPLPMGLLIGDVHPVDLLIEEQDEPIRSRLIAWQDASSLFAWVTPVFLGKGQGDVTQADVAEALAQVTLCPHGGIPQEYYLDNGSEYAALTEAMVRLSSLADMSFNVTLAKPYSPTSKGEIEGFFNILEGIFKGLPGWIGGDRTNKKTENKGRVVAPYRKGLAALEADIRAAVAIYNSRPQSGRLNGLSPLEMLERKIADTGFVARVPSEDAFDLIFSKPESRVVNQGMIRLENRLWHTPALDTVSAGSAVEVLVPLRNARDRIFVRLAGKDLGWAEPLREFDHGDRDGARLQSRLERGLKDAVNALKFQVDPDVSTFEFQKQAVDRIALNAPAPENWSYAIDKTAMPTVAELEAAEDAQRRADMEEFLAVNGEVNREASGCDR